MLGYRRHFCFALQSAIWSFIFISYGEITLTQNNLVWRKLVYGHPVFKPLKDHHVLLVKPESQNVRTGTGETIHFHFCCCPGQLNGLRKKTQAEIQTLPVEATALYNSRESRSHRWGVLGLGSPWRTSGHFWRQRSLSYPWGQRW